MPPLLQYTAIVIGLPVLVRALWHSARLARANRKGTAGMDVTAYGLLPREELDPAEYGPTAPEAADAAAVHARALLHRAWHARGEGYAEDTSPDRTARFQRLLQAAFERVLQGPGPVPLAGRHTRSELDAVRTAPAAVPAGDPRAPLVRHRLAAALTLAGKGAEAVGHFRLLERWVDAEPWTCHADPAAAYDRARALAIVRAVSGLRRQRKAGSAPAPSHESPSGEALMFCT